MAFWGHDPLVDFCSLGEEAAVRGDVLVSKAAEGLARTIVEIHFGPIGKALVHIADVVRDGGDNAECVQLGTFGVECC